MSDQEEKVQQFTLITGANPDRAKFYLDSAAWDVEVSSSVFFTWNHPYLHVRFHN